MTTPEKNVRDPDATILVVEDSRTQAEELRLLLEADGFRVVVAHDGGEALHELERLRPDVIVSDIVMPGIDGYELCRCVKANEALRDIPVILLTSLSDAGDVLHGLACGADNFFTKPYDAHYLTQRIRYLLANRAVRREDHSQIAIEVFFSGQRHLITSDRMQILNLLISTYETAVQKNAELVRTQDELRTLNEQLEARVRERTAALARQTEKYRTLVENIPQCVFHKNREGAYVSCNVNFARDLGLAPEQIVGQTDFDLFPREEAELHRAGDVRVLAENRVVEGQEEYVHDGKRRWIQIVNSPVRENGDEPTGVLGIFWDVTEQVNAARALRLSDDLLHVANRARTVPELLQGFIAPIRTFTGCAAVGIRTLDAEGNIPYAAHDGFSDRFLAREGVVCLGHDACFCVDVATGRTVPQHPCFTPGGSFVCNGTTRMLASTTEAQRAAMRNECNREGYESVALVPIRAGGEILGLIQVADRREEAIPPHVVAALESGALELGAALQRLRHGERVLRQSSQIQTLRAIDLAITSSFDHRVTLGILLDRTLADLQVDAADVLLLDPHAPVLELAAGAGFRTRVPRGLRVRMGEGMAGRAAMERSTVVVPDVATETGAVGREAFLAAEGLVSYAGVPLISKGRVSGLLEVFWRKPTKLDPERLEFFEALAGQAAIALDNAGLLSDLQRTNAELSLAWDATIEGWSRALDLRDKETEGHSLRVTDMTMLLGRALGLSETELLNARRGALLHDIGKVGIPDAILLKPGPLTDDEWVIMRRHPTLAQELLAPIAHLRSALDIPYCHHEKWDGSGYPRKLKGDEIPLPARIFAVVDVWDALRSDRPYRKAWPDEKIRAHIASLKGTHFEPRVADGMLAMEWPPPGGG